MNRKLLQRIHYRVTTVIPYALPVFGGLMGVIWVNINAANQPNPILWIVLGALSGWVLAWILVRLLDRLL